jgi:hypothetical protein
MIDSSVMRAQATVTRGLCACNHSMEEREPNKLSFRPVPELVCAELAKGLPIYDAKCIVPYAVGGILGTAPSQPQISHDYARIY